MSKRFGCAMARAVLSHGGTSKAETIEIHLKTSLTRRLTLEGDGERFAAHGEERGGAVRIILDDGRSALCFISDPDEPGLMRAIDHCRKMAAISRPNPGPPLPGPLNPETVQSESFVINGAAPSPADNRVNAEFEKARTDIEGLDPHLDQERLWHHTAHIQTALVNSLGFSGTFSRRLTTAGVLLRATLGKTTDRMIHQESQAGPAKPLMEVVHRAARRILASLGGRSGSFGSSHTLILLPETAAPLLSAISPLLFPSSSRHSHSGHLQNIGDRIASTSVNLVDDGLHPQGLSSAPFDGEGTQSATTRVIERGILRSLLHDRRSAVQFCVKPTGNCVRESYRQYPAPGITNLLMEPDPDLGEEDLINDIREGVYATSSSPAKRQALEEGYYVVTLNGRRIRRGRLEEPVAGVQFRIPLNEALCRVGAIGGRLRLTIHEGCIGTGIVRLDDVQLEC